MKRLLLIAAMLVMGCATAEIPPWATTSFSHLEKYKILFLEGRREQAEFHFRKAEEELKKTADLNLLARLQLTRGALHVAFLESFPDHEFLKLQEMGLTPENRHYFLFLRGDFSQVEGSRLPGQYREVLQALQRGNDKEIERALKGIENSLSRLVATGLVVRHRGASEAILQDAVDTAGKNGWKGALFVYLAALQQLHEKQNDGQKAQRVKKLLDLLK